MVVHLQHWPFNVVAWLTLKHQTFMWTLPSFINHNTGIEFVCQGHKILEFCILELGLVCCTTLKLWKCGSMLQEQLLSAVCYSLAIAASGMFWGTVQCTKWLYPVSSSVVSVAWEWRLVSYCSYTGDVTDQVIVVSLKSKKCLVKWRMCALSHWVYTCMQEAMYMCDPKLALI